MVKAASEINGERLFKKSNIGMSGKLHEKDKNGFICISYADVNSKQVRNLNVKDEIVQILEEKTWVNPS